MAEVPAGVPNGMSSTLWASLPPELRGRPYQWFYQPVNILGVGPGLPGNGQFQVDNSYAAFACWYGVVSIRDNTAAHVDQSALPATVSMSGSGNQFYNPAQIPGELRTVFGIVGASQPAVWPAPLITPQGQLLNLQVVNLHNATTLDFRFTFHGVLIR